MALRRTPSASSPRRSLRSATTGRRLVLLDASVLVAASHSASGGSALAMEVCQGSKFRAALTVRIILEARVNISEKFGETELLRFYQQLAALEPAMIAPPPLERMAECGRLVGEKDAHVLAAALECGAGYLLTLDRRHLLTPAVLSAGFSVKVMMPGDFLKQITTIG